jgi:hypothetical protein
MEVKFADTFTESLKRMIRHQRWYYKLFELFKYDIPWFFKNIWRFRKALWRQRTWDHHGTLVFMETGLALLAENVEKYGMEVDEPRLKKVAAMRRAVELIRNYNEDNYIDMAEAELGKLILHDWEFEEIEGDPEHFQLKDNDTADEKAHNRKVFDRAREIGEQEWQELWTILRGQPDGEYQKLYDELTEEERKNESHWYKWYDGSDMRRWWD